MLTEEQLDTEIARARRAAPSCSLAREHQLIWRARGRLVARRRRLVLATGAMALAAAVALLFVGLQELFPGTFEEAAPGVATPRGVEHWDLRDGSRIVLESAATLIEKKRESEHELTFELRAGAAEFDVTRRPERTFRVDAGPIAILVIGTRFRVERGDSACNVFVERGQVRVTWPGGARVLDSGERGTFPPAAPAGEKPRSQPKAASPESRSTSTRVSAAPAGEKPSGSSRSQASGGQPTALRSDAEDLFALADGARARGKLSEAVKHLSAITSQYPSNPRAPLAAFTRGRLLLESLGRPGEAAAAFAQARALVSPSSALFEDSLAREVEAHRASGNATQARARAELYRRLYPNGLRLRQVLRSGGDEDAP